jgi:hypothetical protein
MDKSATFAITGGQTVRDVLTRYPATGPIFLQHGPMFTPKPGELYLRYEDLTLEKYAALNRISLDALLELLNAAAERADPPARDDFYRAGPVIGTVGYTGSYREPDPNIELAPVVRVQGARGPE